MLPRNLLILPCALAALMAAHSQGQTSLPVLPRDYAITPVPSNAVEFTDGFWSRRIAINRSVSIPHNFAQCEQTGRIDNFVFAAGIKAGKYRGYQFNDSDVFKAIEGAANSLLLHPDKNLEHYLDSVIAFIAAAQEPDGYLYTPRRLITPDYAPPGGENRWVGMKNHSHELYNAGHLYEAGAAHYLATGKRSLLDVALKNADLVCATFKPGGRGEVPDHQEIEIGLCKLYRVTGDERYLRTAKHFLDERGNAKGHELLGEYAQDHLPVREQKVAVGHAVRAAYMFAGMADVAALSGDTSYVATLDLLWKDVVGSQLYVTGGIGASGNIEGFGNPYALPNLSAYCETCASIALMLWSERMFLLHGDAQYVDVLERVLYNSFLSGVAMTGDAFFYPNPLESLSGAQRSAWFGCACCPPNVTRFVPALGSIMYAHRGDDLFINLFAAGKATIATPRRTILLRQETRYPWDGTVTITVEPDRPGAFAVSVRIPAWAQNRILPGDLYRVLAPSTQNVSVAVNGTSVPVDIIKGFVVLRRSWKKGDTITLKLPMPVHRVIADEKIEEDRGRIAFQRGPLVYCMEGVDAPDGRVTDAVVSDTATVNDAFRSDLLNGVHVLRMNGISARRTLDGAVVADRQKEITAIPYYAWAHRGKCDMTVWPARIVSAARPAPAPTLAWRSTVTASQKLPTSAVNDQLEPTSSADASVPYLHWWPKKGTTEWVQYDFPEFTLVSRVEVYWFDDTGFGECRVPSAWRILYRDGKEWKPVKTAAPYGVAKGRANLVTFAPVQTGALRLELTLEPAFSAGLYEWKVE